MNCILMSFRLIFTWINLQFFMNLSDGFKRISRPSHERLAHVGSTVNITWHYNCKHRFGLSNIYYNGTKMFDRYTNEQNYSQLKNVEAHFSVIGGSNVTIIIPDVDKDKRGAYCCEVNCGGTLYEKCTTLVMYALPRINYLTSNLYGKQGDLISLKCNASGYPSPRITWIHKDTNTTIAHSSVASFNITGKASGGKYCCHVSNGFGNGTNCTSLEVTEPPTIVNTSITSKTNNITLQCKAKGTPAPFTTWYDATSDEVVANGTFHVKNDDCKNKTVLYYCNASNVAGYAKSLNITVKVVSFCKKDVTKRNGDNQLQIIIVVIVCTLVIVALTLICILFKRRRTRSKRDIRGTQKQDHRENQLVEESPYGEPVDAIKVRTYASASNVDYATVEETGYKRVITNLLPEPQHDEASSSEKGKRYVEPVYAKVKKKHKKKDKSTDVPMRPLYDEIPGNMPNSKHPPTPLVTQPSPKTSANDKISNEEEDEVDSGQGSWLSWVYCNHGINNRFKKGRTTNGNG